MPTRNSTVLGSSAGAAAKEMLKGCSALAAGGS
jgi:hypothetical protein